MQTHTASQDKVTVSPTTAPPPQLLPSLFSPPTRTHTHLLLPLHLSTLPHPLEPTAPILPDPLIPVLQRHARRRAAPDARLAVKDDFLVLVRFREPELLFELVRRKVERVRARSDRDVDGRGNPAG